VLGALKTKYQICFVSEVRSIWFLIYGIVW